MLKAKQGIQRGFTIIELLIVIAIIGILATLVLTNFQGAQARGRDTVRKNNINSLYQKLEEYYNDNGGYPDGALSTEVLPGTDAGAFTDADGAAITYAGGFITSDTAPTLTPGNTNEYIYAAYDCATAGAQSPVEATCNKYVLATYLEQEDGNKYQKDSLN